MAKRGLAKYKRRRKRKNPAARSSGIVAEATEVLGPALASYIATKFVSRVAYTLVQRKWPKLGKHAGAIASAAMFGGVYYGTGRINALKNYESPIVVGAAVAAGANIARTYLPAKYAWIAADYKAADVAKAPVDSKTGEPLPAQTAPGDLSSMDEYDLLEVEAGAYDGAPDKAPAGYQQARTAYNHQVARANQNTAAAPTAPTEEVFEDDDLDFSDIPDDGDLDAAFMH